MDIVVKYENCQDNKDVHQCVDQNLVHKWRSSLEEISNREGFIESKVIVTVIPTGALNFLSITCKAELKGITRKGSREIHLFLKHIIPEDPILNLFDMNGIYLREIFMYKEFSEAISHLQIKYNIPETERFKLVKCYDFSNDTIIFDDLTRKGFKIIDRMKVCSLQYAERALGTLAKFHALSFVLSKKMPDFYAQYIVTMKYLTTGHDISDEMRIVASKSVKWLTTENKKNRFSKYCETFPETIKMYMTGSETDTNVLCHGDYKITNLLVREDEGAICEMMPIDYQLVNYGRPVHDVIFFIYGATDRAFRDQHVPRLLRLYHAAMRRFLAHFNLDVDDFYPMKAFQQDYEDRLGFGLVVTTLLLPINLASKEFSNCLVDSKGDRAKDVSDRGDEFKKRLNDNVDEFIEAGLL